MAEHETTAVGHNGSGQARSECRRLLVSDPAGLMQAPLDATDIEPVDIGQLASGLSAEQAAPPLGAQRMPAAGTSGPSDRVEPKFPTVLRHQDDHVLAWDDPRSTYVALRPAHLAVLDQMRRPMSVEELLHCVVESPWEVGGDLIATAVAELAAVGLVVLEVGDDPPPEVGALEEAPEPDEVAPLSDPAVSDPEPDEVELRVTEHVPEAGPASSGPDPDIGLLDGVPRGPEAVRVIAYRVVGRTRRRVRRGWIAAGRRAALRLEGHFGKESDDWPAPPEATDDLDQLELPEVSSVDDQSADATPSPVDELVLAPDPAGEQDLLAAVEADEDHDDDHEDREEDHGASDEIVDHRTPVFGVYHSPEHNANLGLGLIIAHARTVDRGALNTSFDLRRASIDAEPMLAELERTGRQAIVLFSDYMWSIDHNLEVCARVKQLNPASVTIHGGPHAPKYEADAERFLQEHPHVDVLVRGEGELTVAGLLHALGPTPDPTRLDEALADVEGISFVDRSVDPPRVVRTPDRARGTDMDDFPSPYLTGEFDEIDPSLWRSATVETNRGCPYGCTFCDWGSATNSRIRQFDRDRVFAELEWLASRGISEVFLADANFGLFARDVEVARHIAELKQRYGAPMQVICSFAKNTVKYTAEIVRIWVEAGICAEGSVALQTTDEVTLGNVERSNIKVEKYDALAEEFRRHRLPIVTDLLMGLPGATVESFKNDLQRCLDQEVTPRMMETVLLPNSPMNAPEYRERFAIEVDAANVLVSTSSYTRDDFEEMKRLRLLFRACEHYGLMRHLFRWLQVEHGLRALDVLHDIDRVITDQPERYPLLTWVGRYFDLITAPPGGWPPFYDEVVDLLEQQYGIERDAAMDTVLAVQCFLMPSHGRRFPDRLQLDHDYVAWYRATSRWADPALRPQLIDMGPGELVVDDPAGVCDARLLRNGFSIRREEACDNPFWVLNDWELDSELARPMATAVPLLTTP